MLNQSPVIHNMPNRTELIKRLEDYTTLCAAYKKKKLSINHVATALNVTPKTLSGIINDHYQQRFTDWINTYRVNYVIELLKDEDWNRHSLEGVAANAGFASRSAFFASFKKITGYAPLEYIKHAETE